jgi:uncharacterized membrane protein HdeD (DUF308 family)
MPIFLLEHVGPKFRPAGARRNRDHTSTLTAICSPGGRIGIIILRSLERPLQHATTRGARLSAREAVMTYAGNAPLAPRLMLHALARNWWLLLLRGIAALVFGVLTFAWPGVTLLTLVLFYGAFALADGVLAVAAAVMGGAPAPRWWLAVVGLLGIAAGVLTFMWPGITGLLLLFFIAGWAIASGVMQIVGAIRLRHEIDNEWWLVAGGVVSVLFGMLLLLQPGAGALALIFVIGAYALIEGIILVMFSLKLRKHHA